MRELAIAIAAKVSQYLVAPTGRQLSYLFCYQSYTDELHNKVQELRNVKHDVQITVDEATRRGDGIRPIVQEWLDRVDEITGEAEELMKDENKSCFNGWCPNLKSRYLLSREADKKAQVIVQVQEDRNFPGGVSYRVPPRSVTFKDYEPFGSRASILNEIMNALSDAEMKMIGVWGMGGVGKTTLVKLVAEQAKQEKLFTTEVYIDVSWTRDLEKIQEGIAKIQQKIADMLGLEFKGKDESIRAVELKKRLKEVKTLIILDDFWKEIDLEKVGIPCKDDEKECKIVLTSRDRDLLCKDMGAQICFRIQQLPPEEAWSLFKKTAGDSVEKTELQPMATEVVKECQGLPVAIVTIAKALKGESVAVWRNALEELRRSAPTNMRGVSKNVYSCLELSYNNLESDEVKSLFLLCGLLGDGDISLDDLLKYGMGLDLFDYIDSLEQARNKLVTLVEILKASSLLLDALEDGHFREPPSLFFVEECNGFVRMHDVVRDVAKKIAYRDPHRFVVKEDVRLREWEMRDGELRNCTGMSLKCTHVHELPEGLVCPKLRFFLLNNNDKSLKIPDTFFKEMKEVRILSLFRIDLRQLPSSLYFLSNLRTLCLDRCGWLNDIAILGELRKLQVLSLLHCKILEFPKEMMQLTDLRMLSLRDCGTILVPRNVISYLSRLEHLCIRNRINSFNRWESEEAIRGRNAWLSELKHLSCLRALEVDIPSSRLLPEDVSFENLTRYDICMGYPLKFYDDKKTSRRLTLEEVEGPHLVKCFSKLLKTIEDLELRRLDDTKHFVYELEREGFLQLKNLYICESYEMQYIMNTMEMEWVDPPHSAFPLLEELEFSQLSKLEAVCHGPIPMGCFANLRVLTIECCDNLKYILWAPTVQGRESGLVFPQLRSLNLDSLPNLIEFYSTGTSGSQEQFIPFFNQQVAFPSLEDLDISNLDNVESIWHNHEFIADSFGKLKRLSVRSCQKLQNIIPSNVLKRLPSLQILKIVDSNSLKEVFDLEAIDSKESHDIPALQLRELCLDNLRNLKCVWNKDPQGLLIYQNLKSVQVSHCPSLKIPYPGYVVRSLLLVKEVDMNSCRVEEIVAHEDVAKVVTMFLFSQVTPLTNSCLEQLECFYLGLHNLEWPMLKTLEVESHESLEKLASKLDKPVEQPIFLCDEVTFPEFLNLSLKLTQIQDSHVLFGALSNVKILIIENCPFLLSLFSPQFMQCLNNLKKLTVEKCDLLEEVFDLKGLDHGEMLSKLEEMSLIDLPKLRYICNYSPPQVLCFQNLKSLQVKQCNSVTCLFPPSMALGLVQLQDLCIEHCYTMEEIVTAEEGVTDEIIFPQITRVSLLKLPELTGFYPSRTLEKIHMGDSNSASGVLFNEKVAFPNLEDLDISNLDSVEKIWHNHDFIADSFGKLKGLSVRSCQKLQNVIPFNMLKRLSSLQILKIVDLNSLEEVFDLESIDSKESHDIPTLQLRELCLDNLEKLKYVWNKDPQGLLTYQNLKSVQVSHCPSLKIPYPSYVVRSLLQLKEVGMNSREGGKMDAHEDVAKAVTMFLFPEVISLTKSYLKGLTCFYLGLDTLEWPTLKTLKVESCESLEMLASKLDKPVENPIFLCDKAAFPNLEFLNLSLKVKEIQHLHLLFRALFNLKTLIVESSPFLLNLFSSDFIKSLKSLESLTVKKCDRLQGVFDLNGLDYGESEHVEMLPKLERLNLIDLPELMSICNNNPPQVLCFRNLKWLQVKQCDSLMYLFLSSMALGLVQLQIIRIENCSMMEQIVTAEEGVTERIIFPQIIRVSLLKLPKLACFYFRIQTLEKIHMGDSNIAPGVLFNEEVAFPNLKLLCVSGLDNVKKIWHNQLFANAFSKLKDMTVENCNELQNISTFNVLKWIPSLECLRIASCGKFQEVFDLDVTNVQEDVTDNRLSQLVLVDLQNLEHICDKVLGKKLCLQNLKYLEVRKCGSMKNIFSPYTALGLVPLEGAEEVIEFPELSSLSLQTLPSLASFYPGSHALGRVGPGDHDILVTVLFFNDKVAFPNLKFLYVSGLDNIKKIWHNQLFANAFSKLKDMKVENCNELQNLLTSNMLNRLSSLEVLKLDSCGKLREVFDQEVINVQEDVTDTQLSPSVLDDLQQRLHICNKVPGKYLCLQKLKVLKVHNCGSLKNIFSPYTALGLVPLEGMKEIITQEGAEEVIEFPELISLSLESLPSLASFYPGNHTLGRVGPGDHDILVTVLFFNDKVVFPSLESLNISRLGSMKKIWYNKLIENSFSRLAKVEVECCNELQNGLPLFVLKSSNLQTLRIANCGKLKEVFDLEGADIRDDVTETQLNKLELHDLPQLQYIWNRDPYGILTYENLVLVEVLRCQVLKGQFPSCLTRDLSQLEKQLIRSHWTKDLREKDKGDDFVFPEVIYDELELLHQQKRKGKEVVVVSESDYVGEISEDMPGSSG